MPSTASTSSHDPAPAPPPPDERIPLSSVPDVTKLFPPLIQDAIEDELDRNGDSAYYDEFEQLYWMYSGWDEERESFEREWDPLMIRMRDYNRKHLLVMNTGNVKARARLADEDAALEPILAQMNLRRKGPAGLAILRQRHFARHSVLDPQRRLMSLPSIRSRRAKWTQVAEAIRSCVHGLIDRSVLGL
ncbi:RHTO0S07e05490g1_1 [Rhodotorula toruloides]|uniref:RHTO0S07e05490g1_1 n=1 Tax=Rhodotorula toruloides TaxID=5286 RepID=A0A061AZD2_RHOTO|nr:RHTO0S07e05490g1_1 [Rhodotorula toruloides]